VVSGSGMGAQNMPKSTGGLMPQNTGELCDNCDRNRADSLVASGSTCTQHHKELYSWSLEALIIFSVLFRGL
jgi:hypothetical protein